MILISNGSFRGNDRLDARPQQQGIDEDPEILRASCSSKLLSSYHEGWSQGRLTFQNQSDAAPAPLEAMAIMSVHRPATLQTVAIG